MDHLGAGLFSCSAKACAIFNAMADVSANEVFDVTATTSPRSGNVMSEVEPPSRSSRVMARQSRWFARERNGLEVPAEAVAGLLARGQPLWCLEHFDGGGLQQLAAVDRHPERTRSDGVDRNAPAPAKQE